MSICVRPCLSVLPSQFPRKRMVQQRLLQRRQRAELLLVEAFEAAGFGGKGGELDDDSLLLF